MSMTEKVTIQEVQSLPVPRIAFPQVQSLADWYIDQLALDYQNGQRTLTISCFPTEELGFPSSQAAYVVLRSVTQFLYDHEDVESLTILCGGPVAMRGYSLNWNMWYAEYKPDDDDED